MPPIGSATKQRWPITDTVILNVPGGVAMAFAAPSPAPAPRARPGTVNIAVILLYVAAALEVISAILAIATYGDFKAAYEKAYAGTSLQGQAGSATVTVIVSVVIALLLAVIFLVLGILNGKGNRIGRILTWIFGGLALCCLGSSFALGALGRSAYDTNRKNNPDLPSYDQLQNTIKGELPSWYTPVSTALSIIVLIMIVAVIILLALPASHPYFRKADAAAQWEPPVPPSGGPSYGDPPYGSASYGGPSYGAPPGEQPPGQPGPPAQPGPEDGPPPAGPPGPTGPPPSWPPSS
jgi:hypothetical protein